MGDREKRVLDHLTDKYTITSLQAIKEYGNTRLSDSIYILRNKGYDIQDIWVKKTNRYGKVVNFKTYFLGENKEKAQKIIMKERQMA